MLDDVLEWVKLVRRADVQKKWLIAPVAEVPLTVDTLLWVVVFLCFAIVMVCC